MKKPNQPAVRNVTGCRKRKTTRSFVQDVLRKLSKQGTFPAVRLVPRQTQLDRSKGLKKVLTEWKRHVI